MNKTVILKDMDGNVCYPKTTANNVIGLSQELSEEVMVFSGTGEPSTDATLYQNIKKKDFYFDTQNGNYYYVSDIINSVIDWTPINEIPDNVTKHWFGNDFPDDGTALGKLSKATYPDLTPGDLYTYIGGSSTSTYKKVNHSFTYVVTEFSDSVENIYYVKKTTKVYSGIINNRRVSPPENASYLMNSNHGCLKIFEVGSIYYTLSYASDNPVGYLLVSTKETQNSGYINVTYNWLDLTNILDVNRLLEFAYSDILREHLADDEEGNYALATKEELEESSKINTYVNDEGFIYKNLNDYWLTHNTNYKYTLGIKKDDVISENNEKYVYFEWPEDEITTFFDDLAIGNTKYLRFAYSNYDNPGYPISQSGPITAEKIANNKIKVTLPSYNITFIAINGATQSQEYYDYFSDFTKVTISYKSNKALVEKNKNLSEVTVKDLVLVSHDIVKENTDKIYFKVYNDDFKEKNIYLYQLDIGNTPPDLLNSFATSMNIGFIFSDDSSYIYRYFSPFKSSTTIKKFGLYVNIKKLKNIIAVDASLTSISGGVTGSDRAFSTINLPTDKKNLGIKKIYIEFIQYGGTVLHTINNTWEAESYER